MTRGALVIKTYGDAEIAGAILDGMTREIEPLNARELMTVKQELQWLRVRQGVRKYRDDKNWRETQTALYQKYGTKPYSRIGGNALLIWAIACLVAQECWRRIACRIAAEERSKNKRL